MIDMEEGKKKGKDEEEKLVEDELLSLDAELAGMPEVGVVTLKCPVDGCDYTEFVPEYDPMNVPVCPHHGVKLKLVKSNG